MVRSLAMRMRALLHIRMSRWNVCCDAIPHPSFFMDMGCICRYVCRCSVCLGYKGIPPGTPRVTKLRVPLRTILRLERLRYFLKFRLACHTYEYYLRDLIIIHTHLPSRPLYYLESTVIFIVFFKNPTLHMNKYGYSVTFHIGSLYFPIVRHWRKQFFSAGRYPVVVPQDKVKSGAGSEWCKYRNTVFVSSHIHISLCVAIITWVIYSGLISPVTNLFRETSGWN